jgi:hypothetical protein
MKYLLNTVVSLAAIALCFGAATPGGAQTKAAETKSAKQSGAVKVDAPSETPIPKSVFTIAADASQGRNPFFPNSKSLTPAPMPLTNTTVAVQEVPLTLNGLSGPPKRTAILNGRTFEAGEQGEVRLPSGSKILIKCEEIKESSAVFLVAGQRRELRLREIAN